MRRHLIAAILLLVVTAAPLYGQALYVGANEADNEFANITAADMDIIRSKNILFASRSFGLNVKDGLNMLAGQNAMYALNKIWGTSGTDVYAVGQGGTVLHYDGVGWTRMRLDLRSLTQKVGEYDCANLYGVWGRSSQEVYAVGSNETIIRLCPNAKCP